jgi:hypothetical protein
MHAPHHALFALSIVVGLALGACSTASLNTPGAKIVMTDAKPQGCKSLGLITGKGGGAFGGGYIKTDKLMEYALNDLRNKGAKKGATHLRQQPAQLGIADGTTTTVTIVAEAFACKGDPFAAPATAAASAPAACPQAPPAAFPDAPAPGASPVVVESVPDAATPTTQVRLPLLITSDHVQQGIARFEATLAGGQLSARLVLDAASVGAADAARCQVTWVLDGVRLELGAVSHRREAERERYEAALTLDQLGAIEKARRVAGKVCEARFTLEPSERAKLTELTQRIDEERALQAPSAAAPP